jgi:ubiquitin carboxyl-terminal hydrolase 8
MTTDIENKTETNKYAGKGLTGIENLGNTCFLNACIQVLNHTYEFNEFLDSDYCISKVKHELDESVILKEWNELRKVMWSGNGVVNPQRFVYHVQNIAKIKKKDIFSGFSANDISEFLFFIMSCIHTSISRKVTTEIRGMTDSTLDKIATKCYELLQNIYLNEYSEIMEFFYGVYVTEICSTDGSISHTIKPESYFILDLPVVDNYRGQVVANLNDAFSLFLKPDFLEGDNAWFNEKTGQKENIMKRTFFWNFPNILVITLNRASPDGNGKINDVIDFPIDHLDLSQFVRGYDPHTFVYELYGVCNHFGDIYGGHYTAMICNYENKWFNFNDTVIEPIENPAEQIVTPYAYCLFYRKKK